MQDENANLIVKRDNLRLAQGIITLKLFDIYSQKQAFVLSLFSFLWAMALHKSKVTIIVTCIECLYHMHCVVVAFFWIKSTIVLKEISSI